MTRPQCNLSRLTLLLLTVTFYASQIHASPLVRRSGCTTYTIINTRGTGELQGQSTGFVMINPAVERQVPGGTIYNTDYAASFTQMSMGGTADIVSHVKKTVASNPGACVVLEGYSQGAAATVNAMPQLTGANSQAVVAVLLFGDPSHTANLACNIDTDGGKSTASATGVQIMSKIPSEWVSKTMDICADGDPVCGGGMNVMAHLSYVWNGKVHDMSTAFIVKALKAGKAGDGGGAAAATPCPAAARRGMITEFFKRLMMPSGLTNLIPGLGGDTSAATPAAAAPAAAAPASCPTAKAATTAAAPAATGGGGLGGLASLLTGGGGGGGLGALTKLLGRASHSSLHIRSLSDDLREYGIKRGISAHSMIGRGVEVKESKRESNVGEADMLKRLDMSTITDLVPLVKKVIADVNSPSPTDAAGTSAAATPSTNTTGGGSSALSSLLKKRSTMIADRDGPSSATNKRDKNLERRIDMTTVTDVLNLLQKLASDLSPSSNSTTAASTPASPAPAATPATAATTPATTAATTTTPAATTPATTAATTTTPAADPAGTTSSGGTSGGGSLLSNLLGGRSAKSEVTDNQSMEMKKRFDISTVRDIYSLLQRSTGGITEANHRGDVAMEKRLEMATLSNMITYFQKIKADNAAPTVPASTDKKDSSSGDDDDDKKKEAPNSTSETTSSTKKPSNDSDASVTSPKPSGGESANQNSTGGASNTSTGTGGSEGGEESASKGDTQGQGEPAKSSQVSASSKMVRKRRLGGIKHAH